MVPASQPNNGVIWLPVRFTVQYASTYVAVFLVM